MRHIALLLLCGFSATPVWANEGVLPRGRTEAPGKKLQAPLPESKASNDCTQILSNPDSGELYFAPDGLKLYFLSRDPQGPAQADAKTYLYEVDLAKQRFKRIVSLKAGEAPALVGHGQPVEAITVFDFRNGRPACAEGESAGVGIKWSGLRKIIKSFPLGRYKLLPSDAGVQVADMENRTIRQLDLQSYQKRTAARFDATIVPLYWRGQPYQLFAYQPEQRELLRFDSPGSPPAAALTLRPGMKLVQQADLFGTVSADETGKALLVKQLKGWSGPAFRSYKLTLPERWQADRVAVHMDFRSGTLAVQVANRLLRREWPQVLIYDAYEEKLERTIEPPEAQYASQVQLSPSAKHLVVLFRDLKQDAVQGLRIYDVSKSEWRDLLLRRDPSVAPDEADGILQRAPDAGTGAKPSEGASSSAAKDTAKPTSAGANPAPAPKDSTKPRPIDR